MAASELFSRGWLRSNTEKNQMRLSGGPAGILHHTAEYTANGHHVPRKGGDRAGVPNSRISKSEIARRLQVGRTSVRRIPGPKR